MDYDIGLLKTQSVTLGQENANAIDLVEEYTVPSGDVSASGWGTSEHAKIENKLKIVEL